MPAGLQIPFNASVGATKTAVAAAPATLDNFIIVNNTGALAYVQIFNALAANVTVGVTVPDWVIPIPANGGALMPETARGTRHSVGITIACTTTRTGAAGATCDVVLWTSPA